MDEHQKKLSQRHEGRPRKVRFKISSAYSGRVLKQVYEDGQELEPPAKEQSRRFLRHSFEPGNRPCAAGDAAEGRLCPPAKLSAQRISIFKEDKKYSLASTSPLFSDCPSSDGHCRASPIIDFGKIIIYTNNLKIVRAPMDQKELMRRIVQTEGINDWAFIYQERKGRIGTGHKKEVEKKVACNQYMQVSDNGSCFCSPRLLGLAVPVKQLNIPIQAPSMSVSDTSTKFGLKASLCSSSSMEITNQCCSTVCTLGTAALFPASSCLPLDVSLGDR
ncbi:glutaredoxin domain-containing cysteine-rich protein 2 isoform X1 [Cygnus olor]|uniref:glutaredoxin domain-containing cysteine-rich protein 2 isoform X1 n=1 Tax=Cygnus olor TaxID=8869 RepID=UPI001ADE8AB9|nr:glutaredoxin domain-containing cysteine-rich protein 2 isoform X1 [Cygnus olor]